MKRVTLLNLIDPYRKRPELAEKSDEDLERILTRLHESLYEYKFNDYTYNKSSDIIGGIILKQQELVIKEEELRLKEDELKRFQDELKNSYKNINNKPTLFSPNEDYVRPPDKIKREQLISTDNNEDEEFNNILRKSAEEYNNIQIEKERLERERVEKERDEIESTMRMTSTQVFALSPKKEVNNNVEGLDFSIFSNKPEEVTNEFLTELYLLLKSYDIDSARTKINSLSIQSVQWLMKLKSKSGTLRQKITSRDNEAYKCLEGF